MTSHTPWKQSRPLDQTRRRLTDQTACSSVTTRTMFQACRHRLTCRPHASASSPPATPAPCTFRHVGEIRRGAPIVIDRRRLGVATYQHKVGAECLHDVELAFGTFEVAGALRLAARIPKRLEDSDRQAQAVGDRPHFGGQTIECQAGGISNISTPSKPMAALRFQLFSATCRSTRLSRWTSGGLAADAAWIDHCASSLRSSPRLRRRGPVPQGNPVKAESWTSCHCEDEATRQLCRSRRRNEISRSAREDRKSDATEYHQHVHSLPSPSRR